MLEGYEIRGISLPPCSGITPKGFYYGKGSSALEVVICESNRQPTKHALNHLWDEWHKGRPAPVLFLISYDDKTALYGPTNQNRDLYLDILPQLAEQICKAALEAPNYHEAIRFLVRDALPSLVSKFSGIRNEYLFAWHELEHGVPKRPDWHEACKKAASVLHHRGLDLIKALDFTLKEAPERGHFLYAKNKKIAYAMLLTLDEYIDQPSDYLPFSPITHALRVAEEEGIKYVIMLKGPQVRLYVTDENVGVGRRGRTETYIQFHLDLISPEHAGFLWLLLSADSLEPDGTLMKIYKDSTDFASDLSSRLRERVYNDVIPDLAKAVAVEISKKSKGRIDTKHLYSVALTILFRLLFIAYAEDKELLPRDNQRYRKKSLKEKAKEILSLIRDKKSFDPDDAHWVDIQQIFKAIDTGKPEWGIPSYNGGLFSSDPDVSPEGADIACLSLSNQVFGPVLQNLLIDKDEREILGPVDFRSLSVRDFGTIYEGLLENELAIAQTDLTVQRKDGTEIYRPVKKGEKIAINAGEFYLHDKSGARKETGSYYTPKFAVEHLLKYSLIPALDEHFAKLDTMSDADAEAAFFDFKVADIAMGSGHFLVAAVDKIEKKFASYLEKRLLAGVTAELNRLRKSADDSFKAVGLDAPDIDDSQLLRRQIARRCIYGVDINPMAVHLAQVSLWIHTFVPGLPLAFLDHNLVCGNSLVGIGSLDEIREMTEGYMLFMEKELSEAAKPLEELKKLSEADAAEIKAARKKHVEARKAIDITEKKFTMLAATRLDEKCRKDYLGQPAYLDPKNPVFTPWFNKAKKAFTDIEPFHFPIAFPEVFSGENPGFDVIIGNPPWEEAMVEEDSFWARHFPGLHGLSQREKQLEIKMLSKKNKEIQLELDKEIVIAKSLRYALVTGPYPGMGTGDPDLYRAFLWRFWQLSRVEGGYVGVVLPRTSMQGKSNKEIRQELFEKGQMKDLTYLLNNRNWVFPDAHPQYTIVLTTFKREKPENKQILPLRGPFRSYEKFKGVEDDTIKPVYFPVNEVLSWTDDASLPLLPSEESAEVFAQLRKSPRLDLNKLDQWRARPYRELDATNDKDKMKFSKEQPKGFWPVYKGESFDIWAPDRGIDTYYAWINPDEITEYLHEKRIKASNDSRSPFYEFKNSKINIHDKKTLPCFHSRIAFRNITNRTNRRTIIVSLLPSNIVVTNHAPYLILCRGDKRDEAFLLGFLSSIPLDWYARCFIELNVNFYIFNPFPIPRPSRDNPLWKRTVEISGRLASPDKRFAEWAKEVGVECGPLDPDEKKDMIHELDAVVAHLYGLSEKHLVHIFGTFHEGWDYHERLDSTMKHYEKWKKRI